MTDDVKHIVYDELPTEKHGFRLSHLGTIVLSRVLKGQEQEAENELTLLGFLHNEAKAIVNEVIQIKSFKDAHLTVKDLLKNITSR